MLRQLLATLRSVGLLALVVVASGCDEPRPPERHATRTASTAHVSGSASAQTGTGDPAAVTEGDITQASVNGLTVLVKRIPGAELSAMQLYVKGGVRNWTPADAGVENLALVTAVNGGTEKLDKDAFSRKLSELGSDLGAASGNDFAVVMGKGLTTEFDTTFELLADAFLVPALPASELELTRQRMLSTLRHEQESPDARLGLLLHLALFQGHPYERRSVGTAESVASLGRDAAVTHLGKLREASRLLFVVVGDVEPAHVAERVRERFGALPRGSYEDAPLPAVSFPATHTAVTSAKLPTNYVSGAFVAPGWHDPDFHAAMVAMEHLGFRMFEEVRTKRNLSYSPRASLRWATAMPLGSLYVTAVDPNTTIQVMYDQVKKLKDVPLTEADMAAAKASLLTDHLTSSETTDGQAGWLARAQLFGGDWRMEKRLLDAVKSVTAEQVQAFAKRYVTHLQIVVIGDPAKIDNALFDAL